MSDTDITKPIFILQIIVWVPPGETVMDVVDAEKEIKNVMCLCALHVCFCVCACISSQNRPGAPHGVTASLTYMPLTLAP